MSNVKEIPLSTWTIRGQGAPINILVSSVALLASCFGLYSAAHFLRAAVRIRDEQRKKEVKWDQEEKNGGEGKGNPGKDVKRKGKKVKATDEVHILVQTQSDRTPLHLKVKVAWLPVVAWTWLLLADSWTVFITTSPDVDVVWPSTAFDSIGTYFLLVYFILVFSTLSGLINYRKGVKIALVVVSTIIFILSITVYALAELNTATLITDFPPSDGVNDPPVFTNGNGSFIQSEYASTDSSANKASKNDTDGSLRVQVIYKYENLPFRAGDYGTGVLISLGLLWFVSLSTWLAVAACFVLARVRGIFGEWRSAVQRAGSMRRWLNLDPQWHEQGGNMRRAGTANLPNSGVRGLGGEPWSGGRRGGRSIVVAEAATPRESRWGAATVVRVAEAANGSVLPISCRSSVLQRNRATPEIQNGLTIDEVDAPQIVISDTASEISAYAATLQTPSSSVFSSVLLQTVEREGHEPQAQTAAPESFAAPKRPQRMPLVVAVPDSEPQLQGANPPSTPEIALQPSPNSDRSPQLSSPTGVIPTHKWMNRVLLPVPHTRFSRRATLNPPRSQPPSSPPEPPSQSSQQTRQSGVTRIKFTPPPPPPTATHMSESNVLARASAASLITGVSASYGVVLALMIPFLIPGAPPVPLNSVCVLAMRAGYLLAAFGFSRAMEVGAWSADRLAMHSGIMNARQNSGLDTDVGGRRRFRREMNPQHLEIYRSFESSKPMFFPPHPQPESPPVLGETRRRRSEAAAAAAAVASGQGRDFELIPMPEALRARASVIISVQGDGGVEEFEYDETMDGAFLDEIVEEWYPEHMFAGIYAAHERTPEDESG
ncbi:hypothetical protein BJ742DRAFT_780591 [Cladochytrium replicatum]|nr:hypothetical protein BJ742DRAFT_780591 [Cladochytrium replicatum]